jgi:hypothetical protein
VIISGADRVPGCSRDPIYLTAPQSASLCVCAQRGADLPDFSVGAILPGPKPSVRLWRSAPELRTEEVASRRPVMEVHPVSISRVLQLEFVVCGGRLVSVGFRDAILGFGNPSVGFRD